jgi:aminopeptidase N
MKINPELNRPIINRLPLNRQIIISLYILLFISTAFFSGCSLFRKFHQPRARVTTLDSASMQKILDAIKTSNVKSTDNAITDERPYQATSTKVWDLINTNLSVELDYAKAQLIGKAIISLKPHAYVQDSMVLDAKGMEIKEVTDGDAPELPPLRYRYDGKKLTIYLRSRAVVGEVRRVVIFYISKPNEIVVKGSAAIVSDKGLYFINNEGKDSTKPREVWTQGETESNSCWFPTIDKPNQKMTQEISITLEDSNDITLSNGVFIGRVQNKKGVYTDIWRQSLPASPYLTMIAVGKFYVEHDKWRDKQVNYYIEPKYKPYAKLIFGKTPAMMEFYSTRLGVDFPWDKYSQIVVRDYVSGSMENASATLHGDFLQYDSRQYLDDNKEEYISHELFHQWFGDLVTCESWSNLPLNESFATYGEYLWLEHSRGAMEAALHLDEDRNQYMQEATFKQVPMIRYHYNDKEEMFDRHSYQKGGCVLHMLRNYLGDEVFFKGLKIYLEKNKFKSVEINDLRLALEDASGEDLNWFFNQWFMRAGHPKVIVGRSYNPDIKSQNLTIDFLREVDHPSLKYTLPIKVDFYFKDSVHRESIVIKDWKNEWNFNFDEEPLLINIDAERVMLWEEEYEQSKEELIYQVVHAPLYMDKKEAVDRLMDKDDMSVDEKKIVLDYCLNHSFWGVKALSVEIMEFMRDKDIEPYFNKISQLVLSEKKSSLRVSFLQALDKMSAFHDIIPTLRACANDSSYLVMAKAIDLLSEKDLGTTLKICQANEHLENNNVVNSISAIYARDTSGNHADYLVKSLFSSKSIDKSIRLRQTESYIRQTNIEYAYQTIAGLIKYKSKIMEGYTGTFLPDMKNHFQAGRDILAYDMSRTRYTEDAYKDATHKLEVYDEILELLD